MNSWGSYPSIYALGHRAIKDLLNGPEYIKEQLFKWAWPQISRAIINGFPEFYKERLLGIQFTPQELDGMRIDTVIKE